jgi:nitrite reductase/ring-hydroxylating ferredoxin subunit
MFEFVVNLSTPSYAPLRNSMSSVSVYNYGYQKHGILIYRHLDQSEMYAYDATCVDNAECLEKGIVSGDKDNSALGKCARCGAHYTLTDGIHTEKRIRLRAYSITPLPNATEQWRVSNR